MNRLPFMRSLLALLTGFAAIHAAHGQIATDPNEGAQLTYGAGPGNYDFWWWGAAGRTYFIQESTDLFHWTYLPGVIESGADDVIGWGFTSTADKFFLRLRYSDVPTDDPFTADFDGDKVSNSEELENGTDPFASVDSEPDGLPDDWEIAHFGHLAYGPTDDYDEDGLLNLQEFQHGASPQISDSDSDGMNDGFEVANVFNPTNSDEDGNSRNDGEDDSDGDGSTNSEEQDGGTNPCNDQDRGAVSEILLMSAFRAMEQYHPGSPPLDSDSDSDMRYLRRVTTVESVGTKGVDTFEPTHGVFYTGRRNDPWWSENSEYDWALTTSYSWAEQSSSSPASGQHFKKTTITLSNPYTRVQFNTWAKNAFQQLPLEWNVPQHPPEDTDDYVSPFGFFYNYPDPNNANYPPWSFNDYSGQFWAVIPKWRLIVPDDFLGSTICWYDAHQEFGSDNITYSLHSWHVTSRVGPIIDMLDSVKAPNGDWQTGWFHSRVLQPKITADVNRDGVIDHLDEQVTASEPWRWWINDDDDSGETGGDDIPGATVIYSGGVPVSPGPDYGQIMSGQSTVDGVRDLVDFFPVFLDIRDLIEMVPPGANAVYKLKHATGALNFAYTDLKPSGAENEQAGAYLKNLAVAQQLSNAPTFQITAAGVQLSTVFLNQILNDGKGVILLEGRSRTTAADNTPLILEVSNAQGVVCDVKFHIAIDDVEKMFRHKSVRSVVQGWSGQVPAAPERLDEPENYPDHLCIEKNFVFIYGYAVDGQQARGWHSEAFKRMYWSGSRARFYGITWSGDRDQQFYPGFGLRTPNFHKSVNDAFASAHAVQQFVGTLSGETSIAAHSLGNLVVASAQHDWGMQVANYFMVNAALSMEDLQPDAPQKVELRNKGYKDYGERLWASEWHTLPFAMGDHRSTLTWRGRLTGFTGNRINFYSDVSGDLGDQLMQTPPEQVDEDAIIQFNALVGAWIGGAADGQQAFCLQERLKGNFILASMGSTYGGWSFNPYWDVIDLGTMPPTSHHLAPSATGTITNEQLKTHPFFKPGPAELYGANGSNYASPQQNRNLLLAEMIPGRTLAVGGNVVDDYGDANNINMQADSHMGWPAERTIDNKPVQWLHGDLKDVAYTYVFRLYDKWVELGNLK